MGQKDIAEKILEEYNDVFADIVNALIFGGKQIVDPDDLETASSLSAYKADEKIRSLDRDVAKYWKHGRIRIAFAGLENQTVRDKYMPLRVISYDGNEYRKQYSDKSNDSVIYPVVTLVLYFGKEKWNYPKNVCGLVDIPEGFEPFVSDYKMNLFEIAYLSEEQLDLFKSDFRIVAEYFVQTRVSSEYKPTPQTIRHVGAVFQAMSAFTGDKRFEEMQELSSGERRINMCEALDIIENRGIKKGFEQGIEKGIEKGRLALLIELVKEGEMSVETAAKKENMTVEEFKAVAKLN
ncbi:MAG: Rpn family recombination-promoting nuclease/putative transposase [Ruminococcus sp.]|nr:Rpn family recombination-promoting nuclease/putative transposase [Ruminococcus sp.]